MSRSAFVASLLTASILFHDAILAIGSVPLPVLEQRMAQFIADGGVNPPAAPRGK